jgi:insulysin
VIIYRYIALLRSHAPEQAVFDEIKALSDIEFRFHEPARGSAYASDLAKRLQLAVPRETVVSSRWLLERFDPEAIVEAMQVLDIRKGNVAVTAKVIPPGVGPLDQTEPVYGTRYNKDRMPAEIVAALQGDPIPELFLPGPNAFIPKEFSVNKVENDKVGPVARQKFIADSFVAHDSA